MVPQPFNPRFSSMSMVPPPTSTTVASSADSYNRVIKKYRNLKFCMFYKASLLIQQLYQNANNRNFPVIMK